MFFNVIQKMIFARFIQVFDVYWFEDNGFSYLMIEFYSKNWDVNNISVNSLIFYFIGKEAILKSKKYFINKY